MGQKNPEEIDPEMLKKLDMLLEMDVLESEEDWETIEEIDAEKNRVENERGRDET